jgi:HD-GYP domain-containing protein (c-di-GMP phosphodiesterase class II)
MPILQEDHHSLLKVRLARETRQRRGSKMSETGVLLSKIAALRHELDQFQGLTQDPAAATESAETMRRLERKVAIGNETTLLLDRTIRQLTPPADEPAMLPRQLTARARRLLEMAHDLLQRLRTLADILDSDPADAADPLAARYDQTVAMAETALRMIQAFPDAPSAQLRLSEGVEAILGVVAERSAALKISLSERRVANDRVARLAEWLTALHTKQTAELGAFAGMAQSILADAERGVPLRFQSQEASPIAAFVAAHSLTVAQVIARVARRDPIFRNAPLEPVLTALVYDVGMLSVPAEILTRKDPLEDAQRRVIEQHTRIGVELAVHLAPSAAWLWEAVAGHHERLDGTGYPGGLRDTKLAPLTRLLAVCDVYAALCCNRPHRPAFDTRTALVDTLLLAEQGGLDRVHAERLLQLSFYPVGTVVELADGAVAVVVATQSGRLDLQTPARPVIALLTDSRGLPLPLAQHIDLSQCEDRSIVRTLPLSERRAVLGACHPELAA